MKKNIFYFIIPLICVLMIKFINTSTQSEEITISNSSDVVLTNIVHENIDFNYHVKPILSDRCYACHGPDAKTRKAGLRLDVEKIAFSKLASNSRAFVKGNISGSESKFVKTGSA